jgi:predicted nuclease with RNAse H fold
MTEPPSSYAKERIPLQLRRAAVTEARRFNDTTTRDIHVLAMKEIRLAPPSTPDMSNLARRRARRVDATLIMEGFYDDEFVEANA